MAKQKEEPKGLREDCQILPLENAPQQQHKLQKGTRSKPWEDALKAVENMGKKNAH